jgi:hypothetical protein
MATTKQKEAARHNLKKARAARSEQAKGKSTSHSQGMDADQRDRLSDSKFAFPDERKEPLNDADHVRNAISRFNQVEDVSDAERDRAWKRIKAAAEKFDVEVSADDWRDLAKGGKPK